MTKRKPPARRAIDNSPALKYRAARAMTRHPVWSWTAIAGVITVLTFLGPVVIWAAGLVETRWHASAVEDKLRGEMVAHVALLRAEAKTFHDEFAGFKTNINRNMAWGLVQTVSLQTTTLRNRVNDCEIRAAKREPMTELERLACSQYRQEFDDATRRFNEARAAATALSGSN